MPEEIQRRHVLKALHWESKESDKNNNNNDHVLSPDYVLNIDLKLHSEMGTAISSITQIRKVRFGEEKHAYLKAHSL